MPASEKINSFGVGVKIKKGDTVLIISGKDRGKTGKVLKSFPSDRRILVDGINLKKKHTKPKKQGEQGQIVKVPATLNVSNTKLICQKCKEAVRVGYKITEGKKFRICKKCESET